MLDDGYKLPNGYEHVPDISDELQDLINLLGWMDEQPDGVEKIKRIRALVECPDLIEPIGRMFDAITLRARSTSGRKNGHAPKANLDGVNTADAANALAGAFAVIERVHAVGYMPEKIYRGIDDAINEWIGEAAWQTNPRLAKQIMPVLLKEVITRT